MVGSRMGENFLMFRSLHISDYRLPTFVVREFLTVVTGKKTKSLTKGNVSPSSLVVEVRYAVAPSKILLVSCIGITYSWKTARLLKCIRTWPLYHYRNFKIGLNYRLASLHPVERPLIAKLLDDILQHQCIYDYRTPHTIGPKLSEYDVPPCL